MREPPSERWEPIGKHQHRFEPPDLYVVRIDGDVSGQEIRVQIDAIQALAQRTGKSIFWLADIAKMGSIKPDARRAMAEANQEAHTALAGSAMFGASFTSRVMINLLVRAVRILRASKQRPVAFVETEAEARAFLDEHRKNSAPSPPR